MSKINKILLAVCLALIAVVAVLAFVYRKTAKAPQEVKFSAAKITNLENTSLPEFFPAEIPLENGAEITQNYNAEKDGQMQATRKFISKKTLQENFDLYKSWMDKNSWQVVSSIDGEETKNLSAKKDGSSLSVNISVNSYSKKVTVNITYLK